MGGEAGLQQECGAAADTTKDILAVYPGIGNLTLIASFHSLAPWRPPNSAEVRCPVRWRDRPPTLSRIVGGTYGLAFQALG